MKHELNKGPPKTVITKQWFKPFTNSFKDIVII